jgi:hypothetical protein
MLVYIRECDASMVSVTAIWRCYSGHLYCFVLYSILYSIVLHSTVLYSIVYCIVFFV